MWMESISVTTFSRFVASELAVLDHEFFSSTKLILDCEEVDKKARILSIVSLLLMIPCEEPGGQPHKRGLVGEFPLTFLR